MKAPEIIEHSCDVVVVGGGLAGCMAAYRAGELDKDVILVDKSNPERSGCAATGVDHIWAYFPEVQAAEGISLDDMVEDHAQNIARGLVNREVLRYIAATALDRILDLERWGVKIRYDDSSLPGKFRLQYQLHHSRNTLHYDGRDVKRCMTKAVRSIGTKVVDRVMATDLLVDDGQIAGAVGYGTRDGRLHIFHAKAVIMTCGRMNRLYRTPVGLSFTTRMPPTNTGDGKASIFRAGAELINMEFSSAPGRWASKNFVRGGGLPGGSYQPPGVGINAYNDIIAPRNHELEGPWQGIMRRGASPRNYEGEFRAGRGPIYADMSWGTDDDQEYMRWAVSNEGGGWALNHILEQYGLDYRTTKIEIAPADTEHEGTAACGPIVDSHCQTTVPGLYAAGDEAGGIPWSVVPGALTMGYLAAESAVEHAKTMGSVPHGRGAEPVEAYVREIAARKQGDPWEEAQAFIEYANSFYNVEIRSETMARRGLEYMDYLKRTMHLVAANPHEMVHCLEIRNLIECSEIILRSTIERRESRLPILKRLDYPERDDQDWFCFLGQRQENGKILFRKHRPQ